MNFDILKEKIKLFFQTIIENKIYLTSFILFIIISITSLYIFIDYKNNWRNSFYWKIASNFIQAQVVSWNFDIDYKKIPYNIPYIELQFNKKIDEKTVTNKNFTIRPEIKWKIKVEWNTIKYVFDKAKLPVWTEIEVNATSEIKTRAWENISPYYSFLQIWEAPKVVKISPITKTWDEKWILNNLSSHISVFFNVPMVTLTDLDSADKLPCLIDIEPKVEWTCTWTTTSMLEFIPKSPLNGSSSYKIKVSNKDGTLYNLEKEYNSNLETTPLSFSVNEENYDNIYTFSPNNWLKINSNFPVSKEEIQKNIVLENITLDNWINFETNNSSVKVVSINAQDTLNNLLSWEKKSEKVENIKFSIEQIKWSDTNFLIKSDSFKYNKNYKISFKEWINSKNGNEAYKKDKSFSLKTNNFVNSINVYQKRFSSTWAELDPLYTTNYIYNLANKNAYLDIYLDEEIQDLSPDFFAFVDSKWNKINYTLNYFKDEAINDKWEHFQKEDKKHIKLEIQENLPNFSKYKFIVSKNVNKSLESDLTYEYSTSIPLKVLSNKYISYNKNCVYTNTNLGFSWTIYNKDFSINFWYTPDAKIFSIWEYEANTADRDYSILIPWEEQDAFNSLSNEDKDKKLISLGLCPMAPTGQILYVINHRLNPNSTYKFETKKDSTDLYGNKITNSITSNIKTWNDIKGIDKYVYTTVSKEISVIPKQASIIFPVQTINLDSMTFDICEMNKAWYLDYLKNRYNSWYNPICTNQVRKVLALKNKNWNLSYTKFDVEKDILWTKSDSNFILIRWYSTESTYKSFEEWKSFQNLYIRSDIQAYGEIWWWDEKTGTNKSIFFVTDFSGNPITSLETETYMRKYDSSGNSNFSKINLALKYEKDWVYSTNMTNLWWSVIFLKSWNKEAVITTDQDEAGNYDFGYNWWIDSYTKNFLYLYTDRPIYKPGDKVYFKGLSRLFSINWYKKVSYTSGKLELLDSNYKTIKSIDVKLDTNSNFAWEFDLSKDAWIWKYNFRFTVNWEEIINNASFDIEEYIKPIFKVNLSQDKKDFMLWEETKIKVNPEYYFGGKVISTKWTYSVLSQNYFFDSKEYGDYQFWETTNYFDCLYWGYCSYDDNLVKVQEFNIDSAWNYNLDYKYPRDIKTWEKLYTITAEVEDPDTKKVVSNSVTNILHNTDAYLWISLPWWNDKKNWIKFSWVVLDYEAKSLENKSVKLEIYKRDYKQVKKQWVDWNFYNDYTYEDKLEDSLTIKSDNKWKIEKNIFPKSDGTYFIKAIYTWKNWQNFISSKEIYISGDNYIDWNNWNNDVTDLVADKSLVSPWEVANYTLKSPVNNWKALILVEKDDWVIDYVVHSIKSYSDRISIPVKDSYYPNFYVKVFLIWNWKNWLPVYKRALNSTKVLVDNKKINVKISSNKTNYLPGEKLELTIKVTNSSWKAVANANWSIAVVDESLLALVWNPKKNPFAFFYEMKRYLGTVTYISLKNLVEKLEVKDIWNGEKWWAWDQVKWWDSNKKRWIFKDTAYWKSDFTTDKNWEFKIITDALPDNLTTWDIESVVTSPDNKVWIGRTSISTNKKVMLNDNLPAFLWSSDSIKFSPVVFNKTWIDQNFIITFEANNQTIDKKEEKVFIKNGEQKTINFESKIMQNNSLSSNYSKINIKAVATDTKDQDEVEKTLEIKNTYLREVVASAWSTNSSKTETIDIWNIIKYPWYFSFNYSATLLTNLTDSIDYLNNYTYGCSEQKTSAIMPNIFIKKLYDSAKINYNLKEKMIDYYAWEDDWYKKKSLDEVIKDYLVDIKKFQKDNWWFGYWKDLSVWNNFSDFALTSYILESISEIRNIWYSVDSSALDEASKYLKNRFYKNNRENCKVTKYDDCKYSEIDRLKAIEAIVAYDSKDYEAYKMYKLINKKENRYSSFFLEDAETMANLYDSKIAFTNEEKDDLKTNLRIATSFILNQSLVYSPKWAYVSGNENINRIQNTAVFVYIMSKSGIENFKDNEAIMENILRWMIAQKTDSWFGSTADNISVIKAFTSYLQSSKELENVSMEFISTINWENFVKQKFDNDNKLISLNETKDFKDMKYSSNLNISKTWTGKAYYDMNLVYYVPSKEVKARNSGFYLETKYFDYNDYKKIEVLKKEEWTKYLSWEITYEKLVYPNEISTYLNEVDNAKVGQLILVYNKLIVSEDRDKVAFEWFIPSWAEIVNPHFATSTAKSREFANNFFDRTEYRLDRFFAYKTELNTWNYDFIYLMRATHSWIFNLKSSQIYEFYNPEVFGRTAWREFEVK